jgi:hypothetical protein
LDRYQAVSANRYRSRPTSVIDREGGPSPNRRTKRRHTHGHRGGIEHDSAFEKAISDIRDAVSRVIRFGDYNRLIPPDRLDLSPAQVAGYLIRGTVEPEAGAHSGKTRCQDPHQEASHHDYQCRLDQCEAPTGSGLS